jgi:FkbM family methyltransferase
MLLPIFGDIAVASHSVSVRVIFLLFFTAPHIQCTLSSQASSQAPFATAAGATSFDDLQDCEDTQYYTRIQLFDNKDFGLPFVRQRCPRLSADVPPGIVVMYPGVLVSAHIAHCMKVISGSDVSYVELFASKSKCPLNPHSSQQSTINLDPIILSPTSLSDMKIASPGLPRGSVISPPRMCDGDQSFFEHWSVLTAVQEARHSFVMMELGAGWGRIAAYSAAAARMRNLPFQLVLVEANDVHYQFLLNTMSLNQIPPSQFMAIHGAITANDATVSFERSNPDMHYGARVFGKPNMADHNNPSFNVLGYSLESIFSPYFYIDFVHFDIQGTELAAILEGRHVLKQRVKRVYVECHTLLIFEELLWVFEEMNWNIEYELPPGSRFTDSVHGHISAVNPFIN